MGRKRIAVGVGVAMAAVIGVGVYLTLRDNAEPVGIEAAKERIAEAAAPKGSAESRRPEPGVYRYEGSGTESPSTPPLSQGQGPTLPGPVGPSPVSYTHLTPATSELRETPVCAEY